MRRLILILIMFVSFMATSWGHTSGTAEATCPLCNEKFTYIADMSGTSFGMRLDLKKLGPIASPWSIPVCPKCKFVVYDKEISQEEITSCKALIESPKYKSSKNRASYYLLGLLYEGLNRGHGDTAHVYLKASWQEEGDEQYLKETLGLSLKYFNLYLQDSNVGDSQEKNTALLLKGELLRRLGSFDEAKKHLMSLKDKKDFQDTFLGEIVDFEIKLCNKNDDKPHEVSEAEKNKDS